MIEGKTVEEKAAEEEVVEDKRAVEEKSRPAAVTYW